MWLFRLPAVVYFGIAPLLAAFAIYLYLDDRQIEADKALARKGQAPAEMKLEDFARTRSAGLANEVNLVAQVDIAKMMDITKSKRGVERDHWVIAPIYPTTAENAAAPAIGLMVQRGNASDAQIAKLIVGDGKFGPLMKLNGFLITGSADHSAIREATKSVRVVADPVYVDPFEAGRDAGLAPDDTGFTVAIAALVAAIVAGGYGFLRLKMQKRREEEFDPEPEMA